MATNVEYHKFETLEDAYPIAMALDHAMYQPIHVGEPGFVTTDETVSKAFRAIVNKRTNIEVNVPSTRWRIVQHPDFFIGVVDKIKKAQLDGRGQFVVMNNGNKVKMQILFDDVEKVSEPGFGSNIQIGSEFVNSYLGDASAAGRAYYMRISCFNQFTLANVIPEVKFSRIHRAMDDAAILEDVLGQVDEYIINLLGSGKVRFKHIMDKAIEKVVKFESEPQLTKTFIDFAGTTKHGNKIVEILLDQVGHGKLEFTQWDIYNAVTQHATHGVTSEGVRENMLRKGESRLLRPNAILVTAIMNDENAVEMSTV